LGQAKKVSEKDVLGQAKKVLKKDVLGQAKKVFKLFDLFRCFWGRYKNTSVNSCSENRAY